MYQGGIEPRRLSDVGPETNASTISPRRCLADWRRPGEHPRQILAQANLHLLHAKFDLLGDCKDVAKYLGKFDSEERQELPTSEASWSLR